LSQAATATQTCRVLYYGPGGAGKRENLRQIIDSIPPEQRLSLTTSDPERQIAFRMRSGTQGEWAILVQAMDTGREIYNQSSQKDRPPFDGVVFVAHSSASRLDQSLSSMEELKNFIDSWGKDVMSLPLVIQYNKREEPGCLPVDRLESLLNPWGLLSFPASTQQGEGIKETLKAILSLTISQLLQDQVEQGNQSREEAVTVKKPPVSQTTGTEITSQAGSDSGSELLFTRERDKSVFQVVSEDRSGIFFDELRPPIVVPVRIPKKLLEKYGSARIILEVELDDSDSVLS